MVRYKCHDTVIRLGNVFETLFDSDRPYWNFFMKPSSNYKLQNVLTLENNSNRDLNRFTGVLQLSFEVNPDYYGDIMLEEPNPVTAQYINKLGSAKRIKAITSLQTQIIELTAILNARIDEVQGSNLPSVMAGDGPEEQKQQEPRPVVMMWNINYYNLVPI